MSMVFQLLCYRFATKIISDKIGLGFSARRFFCEKIKAYVFGVRSSIMLLGSVSWSVKEENVTSIGRNDATMVRWMCSVILGEYHDRMFTELNVAMVWSSRKDQREYLA